MSTIMDHEAVLARRIAQERAERSWTLEQLAERSGVSRSMLSKIERQEAKITRQQKQIEELTAGLQKVSAQLELSKPAPETVLNNQR